MQARHNIRISCHRKGITKRGECTDDTDQTSLESRALARPCKVSAVEAESAVFGVSTAGTDGVDTLGTELSVSGLTAELEFSLFAVVWALSTGGGALVARRTRDT